MRMPLELEHLVKTAVEEAKDPAKEGVAAKPTSLAECMAIIDSRKALEVEHYLRACALRLDIVDGLGGLASDT